MAAMATKAPMAAEAAMAKASVVEASMTKAAMVEAAMEMRPEKERPGANEERRRAVIRIGAGISVIRVTARIGVGVIGIVAGIAVAVARRRRLDDVALARHALGIGDVVLPLRSSGDGARVARADRGACQQSGAGADCGPLTGVPGRRTQQRAAGSARRSSHGGAADRRAAGRFFARSR